MPDYRVRVLGGYEKVVTAGGELEAKREALKQLRLVGHSLRAPNRDGSESYRLEDVTDGPSISRRAEVHALRLDAVG